MSTKDSEIRGDLSRAVIWLEEGKQKFDEIAGLPSDQVLEKLASMDKTVLDKIVLYHVLRERFGQESAK